MQIIEKRVFSQNGEDGILESIFKHLGVTNKVFAEIGCGDASECNTRKLSEVDGWHGVRVDAAYSNASRKILQSFVETDNVCGILRDHDIPEVPDLLSIDVDFNDFHILHSVLDQFSPRVICVEYNSSLGPDAALVVPYTPNGRWDGTNYFGGSFRAFEALGKAFGYRVCCCDSKGVNLFLIRGDLWQTPDDADSNYAFRGPGYGRDNMGHRSDPLGRPYLTPDHYLLPGVATARTEFGHISYFKKDQYIGAAFSSGRYWDEGSIRRVEERMKFHDGLCLDVGAHVGSHSIALSKLRPDLKFICFEPQRPIFLLLERNILENGLAHRISARHCAVGHQNGRCSLSSTIVVEETNALRQVDYGSDDAPINFGGMQLGSDGAETELISLDSLDLPRVAYLKVDVEGAETLVFSGARNLLRRDRPLVYYEDRTDRRLSSPVLEVLGVPLEVRELVAGDFLASLDYRVERSGRDFLASCIKLQTGTVSRGNSRDEVDPTADSGIVRPASELPPPPRTPAHEGVLPRISAIAETIPKLIFQTWKSRLDLPEDFRYWTSTLLEHNPAYDRVIWDDGDNRRFISDHFEWFMPTYDSYPAEIYRVDAVRYFFLYVYGGLYADMDVECLKSLDDVLSQGDVILGRMGSDPNHPHSIPNAIMASRPRRDFWLLVIRLMQEVAPKGGRPEGVTGPVLLKSAVDLYQECEPRWMRVALEKISEISRLLPDDLQPVRRLCDLRLLPSREWFAVDWTDPLHQRFRREILNRRRLTAIEKKELFPESSLITYWSHSWE